MGGGSFEEAHRRRPSERKRKRRHRGCPPRAAHGRRQRGPGSSIWLRRNRAGPGGRAVGVGGSRGRGGAPDAAHGGCAAGGKTSSEAGPRPGGMARAGAPEADAGGRVAQGRDDAEPVALATPPQTGGNATLRRTGPWRQGELGRSKQHLRWTFPPATGGKATGPPSRGRPRPRAAAARPPPCGHRGAADRDKPVPTAGARAQFAGRPRRRAGGDAGAEDAETQKRKCGSTMAIASSMVGVAPPSLR